MTRTDRFVITVEHDLDEPLTPAHVFDALGTWARDLGVPLDRLGAYPVQADEVALCLELVGEALEHREADATLDRPDYLPDLVEREHALVTQLERLTR